MDIIAAYKDLTDAIGLVTGLSRPMLHVHAGMAIYVMTQLILGERRGSVVALGTVVCAELGNEVMNRLYWGSWRWADTLGDIATTLFWPAMCVMLGVFGRWRWRRLDRLSRESGPARPWRSMDAPPGVLAGT